MTVATAGLRLEPLHYPFIVHYHVDNPIVDTRLSAFPELDAVWAKAESSEMGGAWHLSHGAELGLLTRTMRTKKMIAVVDTKGRGVRGCESHDVCNRGFSK